MDRVKVDVAHLKRAGTDQTASFPRTIIEPLEIRRLLSVAPTLDTSFGNQGASIADYDDRLNSYSTSITQTKDGHFIVGGFGTGGGFRSSLLFRYTATGGVDATYGNNGQASTWNLDYFQPAYAVDPSDGSTIVAQSYGAQRYLSNGTVDPNWTNPGFLTYGNAYAVVLRGAGKSLIATDDSLVALNANGTLDTTFAGTGTYTFGTTTVSGSTATQQFSPRALVIQPDGTIVVGGALETISSGTTTTQAEILRFSPNGGGRAASGATQLLPLSTTASMVDAMTIDSNGLLVVAGQNGADSFVERLTTANAADSTFGSNGVAQFDMQTGANEEFSEVATDPQGRLILADVSTSGQQAGAELVRLTSAGSLDTSFANAGVLGSLPGVNAVHESIGGFVPQSDGSIVVSFSSEATSNDRYAVGLLHLTSSGSLDTTFGTTSGITQSYSTGADAIYSPASVLQSDGKLLLAGFEQETAQNFVVMRLNVNGSPDTTFGSTGQGVSDIDVGSGLDRASGILVQSDGKILVFGSTHPSSTGNGNGAIVRLNANGSVDTTFGTNGFVITPASSPISNFQTATIQADGKIVVASELNLSYIMLQRYNADGSLDTTFGSAGTDTLSSIKLDPFYSSLGTITALSSGQLLLDGVNSSREPYVARLTSAGALDSTFGSGGICTVSIDVTGTLLGLVTESDGSIRVGTTQVNTDFPTVFDLSGITAAGSINTSFGTSGTASLSLSQVNSLDPPDPQDSIGAFTQTPNGEFVIAGTHTEINPNLGNSGEFVAEMNSDGSPDKTFAPAGEDLFLGNLPKLTVSSVQVNAQNQIVVGGSGYSNSSGSTFAAFRLNDGVAPTVTTNPSTQTLTVGQDASFTAAATGSPTPTVQWMFEPFGNNSFTALTGQTSTTLDLGPATLADRGYYEAVFSNGVGSPATTTAAALFVNAANVAPSITVNPVSQTVTAATDVQFTAAATGSPTPTVQWMVEPAGGSAFSAISGATSTTLDLGAATLAQSGNKYEAVFSNGVGSPATTTAALLTVNPATAAPVVTTNPASQSLTIGQDASFSAAASGNPQPTVRWMVEQSGGSTFSPINGATSTTLDLGAATLAENGNKYEAVFSNGVGSPATTTAATLTVTPATPVGSLSGVSSTAASSYNLTTLGTSDWAHWGVNGNASIYDHKATGGSLISNVSKVGTGGFGGYVDPTRNVSWTDGTPTLSDADDSGYLYANNAIGAGYSFTVPASTNVQTLDVYLGGYSSGSTLTAHLSDKSAADYVVNLSSSGHYNNIVAITYNAASAGQTLTLTYVKSSNINGTGGSSDLIAAWLAGAAVGTAPIVTTNPTNLSVTAGATATFTAAASGTPTPTVQWMVEPAGGSSFSAISGATSTTLNLGSATVAQSGNKYEAVFTNGAGSPATTTSATLIVTAANAAPVVTVNPTSQSVALGHDTTFTAAATGTPTPTVQWMVEPAGSTAFSPISGATSPTLDVGAATLAQSGNKYEAVFSNGIGSPATTTAATLTVTSSTSKGSLSGVSSTAASSYNLTALGTSDWAHWGVNGSSNVFDHKASGGSQISNVKTVGSGSFGGYTDPTRTVSWTDGTPTSTNGGDHGYLWANTGIGAGYSFTVPASTATHTLYVYLGGYSSGSTLTAHLSDGSAADYVVNLSNSGHYNNVVAITYNAASAGQTLTLTYVKSSNINGTGGSSDLIAAWLT